MLGPFLAFLLELVDVLFDARPPSPLLPSLLCLTFARLDPAVAASHSALLTRATIHHADHSSFSFPSSQALTPALLMPSTHLSTWMHRSDYGCSA